MHISSGTAPNDPMSKSRWVIEQKKKLGEKRFEMDEQKRTKWAGSNSQKFSKVFSWDQLIQFFLSHDEDMTKKRTFNSACRFDSFISGH